MNINDIFKQADEVIKTASKKAAKEVTKTASVHVDSEVSQLAEAILNDKMDYTPPAPTRQKVASREMTNMEKIAHSVAIVDTLLNIAKFQELEKLASVAEERGYSKEEIQTYIEKKAMDMEILSVAPMLHLTTEMAKEASATEKLMRAVKHPATKAVAALGVGATLGNKAYKKGKQTGREEAFQEVRNAFRNYNS